MKGGNILVRPHDFWPTLLDFGAGDFLGAPTLTRELLPPGTPYYRSPEALRFHWLHRHLPGAHYKPGPADDVYALGVTAYCLSTGAYPHPVLSAELLDSDPSFRPPVWEPPEQRVTVCPELAALVRQLLSLEPSARSSAAELEQALEEAIRTAGPQADEVILPVARREGRGGGEPRAGRPEPPARMGEISAPQPLAQQSARVSAARRSWTREARVLGAGLAIMGGAMAVFALQPWVPRYPPLEQPEESMLECRQDNSGADPATSGLGSDALTARVDTCEPEPSREEISLEMLGVARGKQGKHGVKQVDRLLSNSGIPVWELFALWVPYVLGQRSEAVVVLDWTDFEPDDQTVLVASLVTQHGRATPLLWMTVQKSALKGLRNSVEQVGAVVCVKKKGMKEPWCLATSLHGTTAAQVVALYSRRFTIEENFRETKDLSSSFAVFGRSGRDRSQCVG